MMLGTAAVVVNQKKKGIGLRKERSRWEIVKDILISLQEEKPPKTRIMQRAYVDWRNFHKYFDFLLEDGFVVECNPEKGHYEITDKGRELLKKLKEVDGLLG